MSKRVARLTGTPPRTPLRDPLVIVVAGSVLVPVALLAELAAVIVGHGGSIVVEAGRDR